MKDEYISKYAQNYQTTFDRCDRTPWNPIQETDEFKWNKVVVLVIAIALSFAVLFLTRG